MKKPMIIFVISLMILPVLLSAHCQIPCGIYDDELRISLLKEHAKTLEKSISEIQALTTGTVKNDNQLVRWIINKDEHADMISEIVSYYFLAQRIKEPEGTDKHAMEHYETRLKLLHKILVLSMQVKQNDDIEHVNELKKYIRKFEEEYIKKP
ncbi:MAG: superoxide dismutase [Candidatus Marinimicrobia bacterium]|nr:superoxide dismutase [Candidatus Neomarinimicrobiota bacterium]